MFRGFFPGVNRWRLATLSALFTFGPRIFSSPVKSETDASVSKRPRPCSEKAGLVSGNSDHGPRMGSEDDSFRVRRRRRHERRVQVQGGSDDRPEDSLRFRLGRSGCRAQYTRSMRSGLLRAVSIDESEPEKPEKTPPRLAIDSVVLFRDLFGFFIFRPAVAFL